MPPRTDNRRRRASSGASVVTLPPEPVRSNPLALHPAHVSRPSSLAPTRSYVPSVLTLLQSTHRYSSYVLSGFLGLHALNTCIIPLVTVISNQEAALSEIDNGFMITRYLYRPSESVEMGLILVPLGIHVLIRSGFASTTCLQGEEFIWRRIISLACSANED